MKKYIFRLALFSTIIAIITVASFCFNRFIYARSLRVNKSIHVLILGDSRTECSINDEIINGSVNLSQSADSYFYSYLKLKEIIKRNPQIDTLLLAISDHSLLKSTEIRWLFNTAHINDRFARYSSLMGPSEIWLLLKNNQSAVVPNVLKIPKTAMVFLVKTVLRGYDYKNLGIGGYLYLSKNNLNNEIYKLKNDNNRLNDSLGYSAIEIKYLNKIVNYCGNNSIRLIFISTPVHTEYIKANHKSIALMHNYYISNLSNYPHADLMNLEMPDSCYGDLMHLNYIGAKTLSEYINGNNIQMLIKNTEGEIN